MSQDQLRGAIETIRLQIQSELEAQLDGVERQHRDAVERARKDANEEADARWTRELNRVRADWESRLQAALAEAAGETDRRIVAETTRVRVETERQGQEAIHKAGKEAAAAAERARVELEQARAEQKGSRAELEQVRAGREQARVELEQIRNEREQARAEVEQARVEIEQARAGQEQIRGELEQVRAEREQARVELEQARAEEKQIRAEQEQGRVALQQARAEREKVLAEHDQARLQLEQAMESERSRSADEQREHAERVAQLERAVDEARKRSEAFEEELATLRAARERDGETARELLDAESQRVRALTAEISQVRRAVEDADRGRQALEERSRQLLEEKGRRAAEREAGHAREIAEGRAAERQSQLAATERLLGSIRAISDARSLSDVFAALVNGAAAESSRATVLLPSGSHLQQLTSSGFGPDLVRHALAARDDDVLHAALRDRRAVAVTHDNAPGFAALLQQRAGLAVPIIVGGRSVAVLYADNARAASPEVPAAWPEAVEILCHHASTAVSHLTAVRTTQAMRLMRPPVARGSAARGVASGESEADQAARRYAKLLVSEIKLYNESAVRIGREKHDLLNRLRPEIDRARRLYEERVPSTVTARDQYFDQELRQTLADGDPALLGQQAVFP